MIGTLLPLEGTMRMLGCMGYSWQIPQDGSPDNTLNVRAAWNICSEPSGVTYPSELEGVSH